MAEALSTAPQRLQIRRMFEVSAATAHTIRFGVATAAAIWIGKAPGLVENSSHWILITVLLVMQPTSGGALSKGLLRIVGTLAAAVISIALFGWFAQDPPLLLAGLFLVQAIAAYGYTGPRFQYAWFVLAFTTAIVLGSAIAGQGAVETLAFQRSSMVCIGVLLVVVVDSVLWPARAQPQLRQSLARRARQLGKTLRSVIADPGAQKADEAPAGPGPDSLASQLVLVDAVRAELGVSAATTDGFAHLSMLLETLDSRARAMSFRIATPAGAADKGAELAAAESELARRVDAAFEELAQAVSESRAPRKWNGELEQALLAVEVTRDGWVRASGPLAALEGRVADLRDLVAVLSAIERLLSEATEPRRDASVAAWSHWRPDPIRTRIALRTGIAVIASFLVPAALGWPTNMLVAPFAFMFSALTRGAALQTLVPLALAILLGWMVADASIVYLTPDLPQAPLGMLAPLALAAVFAYVGASHPRLAMLPSIGGLVALLSTFGGTGAPTDVYGAYNTVCYMSLGVGVGWLFSRIMWPATAAGLFRQRVAAQLSQCLESARAQLESEASDRPTVVANLIRTISGQSAQLGRLHAQADHEPVERALDAPRRAKILALTADLMDAIVGVRPETAQSTLVGAGAVLFPLRDALRREGEALVDSMQTAVDALRGDSEHGATALAAAHRTVEDRLQDLRAEPIALPDTTPGETQRFLAEIDARRKLVERQCSIEEWVSNWRRAVAAETRVTR